MFCQGEKDSTLLVWKWTNGLLCKEKLTVSDLFGLVWLDWGWIEEANEALKMMHENMQKHMQAVSVALLLKKKSCIMLHIYSLHQVNSIYYFCVTLQHSLRCIATYLGVNNKPLGYVPQALGKRSRIKRVVFISTLHAGNLGAIQVMALLLA